MGRGVSPRGLFLFANEGGDKPFQRMIKLGLLRRIRRDKKLFGRAQRASEWNLLDSPGERESPDLVLRA